MLGIVQNRILEFLHRDTRPSMLKCEADESQGNNKRLELNSIIVCIRMDPRMTHPRYIFGPLSLEDLAESKEDAESEEADEIQKAAGAG